MQCAISNKFCTEVELKEQPFRTLQKVDFEPLTQPVPFDVLSHILILEKHDLKYAGGHEQIQLPQ